MQSIEYCGMWKRRARASPPPGLYSKVALVSIFLLFMLQDHLASCDRPPNDDKVNASWVSSNIMVNQTYSVLLGGGFPGLAGVDFVFQNFTASGINTEATMEEDEPSHGSYETTNSLWWKWLSPINATMRVSTAGSQFDTAIGVYIPVPWDGSTVIGEFGVQAVHFGKTDDVAWNTDLLSSALFTAHAGQFYYIAVGGFRGSRGSISVLGTVEAYILPPPVIPQVQTPVFSVSRVGEPRDAAYPYHDRFNLITLTTSTAGADIFYTLDLSTPKIRTLFSGENIAVGDSTILYTTPIPMDALTIRAVAFKAGMRDSLVATSTSFRLQATAPEVFPDGGSFNVSVQFSIFTVCDEEKREVCVVRYTLDGSVPDLQSPVYTIPVTLNSTTATTVRAALWVQGMQPSNVTTSQPFAVLPLLSAPVMSPAGTQCGFGELRACATGHIQYDTSVNITASVSDPNATILYSRSLNRPPPGDWQQYTQPLQLRAGVHRVTMYAMKPEWTDSMLTTGVYEVLQAIEPLGFGQQRIMTLNPGAYRFYRLNVTNMRSDIVISVTSFFGITDIALSGHVLRPTELNGDNKVFWSRAAAGQGSRLSVLHTEFDFEVDEVRGTPVYVSIRSAGAVPTQLLLSATVDISPVIRLAEIFGGTVDYGKWRYFKFYTGQGSPGSEPFRTHLDIQVVQSLQLPIGVRVAFKEGSRPLDSDLATIPNAATGSVDGEFDLRVQVSQQAKVYYIGVRGLYAIAPAFNFTVTVNFVPIDKLVYTSVPKSEGTPICDDVMGYAGDCSAAEVYPGRAYTGLVPTARFAYYTIQPTSNSQGLRVDVTEVGIFTGGLQLLLQQDVHPTVAANVQATVVQTAATRTYTLTHTLDFGHAYILGVFGFSYMYPSYNYTMSVTLIDLPSTPRPGGGVPTISSITNNYR
jgi:hypothetical protein